MALIKQLIRPFTGDTLRRQPSASDAASEAIHIEGIGPQSQQQESLRLLGLAFQQIREEQQMSVSELAAVSGVAVDQIAALEAGELDADLEMLLALADGLGVRASTVFIRVEELGKQAGHED